MLDLTLNDGQEDDDDEEEEGDVKKYTVEFIGVASWVLDLIPDAASCSHPDIHVEKVALWKQKCEVEHQFEART